MFLFSTYSIVDGGVTKPSKSDDLIASCSINYIDLLDNWFEMKSKNQPPKQNFMANRMVVSIFAGN
jgi:hypothetical protein